MRKSSLLAVMALVGPVFGQATAQEPSTAIVTDEIVVRGKTGAALRLEIERAENAVFERFNEINSRDDLDIRCKSEVRTGTRIPQRVCAPIFLRDAQAAAAQSVVASLQGSAFDGGSEAFHAAWASHRYLQLEDEMRRLVREDEQLLAAMQRLLELRQTGDRRPVRARADVDAPQSEDAR